jgi:hypothetical protein
VLPRLIVDSTRLEKSSNHAVTVVIFWKVGNDSFPDEKWNDFVVVILSWWIEACLRLTHDSEREILRFMDGPYQVRIELDGKDLRFFFEHRIHNKSIVITSGVKTLESFRSELRNISQQIITKCKALGFESQDIEKLQKMATLI